MQYRMLGRSDLKVSAISFGAWAIGGWMWGGTDDEAAVQAIHKALDLGITCIDTAAIYGMGHSERVVGRAIAGRRDGIVVATKCGLRWNLQEGAPHFDTRMADTGEPVTIYRNLRPDSIKYECEQSLRRLGVDVIDLYQCHWPDPTSNFDDAMSALLELQQQGKIRAIGVSNFTSDMLRQGLKSGVIASAQPKYSPLDRDIEADLLPFCVQHSVGVLAYSPLAQGIMTGKITMDREFKGDDCRRNRPWFQPKNRRRALDMLEKIRPIADGHHNTLGQVAINWVINQNGLTSALVGARTPEQVAEHAGAASFTLSESALAEVRRLVEELGSPL